MFGSLGHSESIISQPSMIPYPELVLAGIECHMKGMFLGMKSNSLIDDALELQPTSPLVQKLYAGSKLYTPEMFGGDPREATESFAVAIEIYEGGEDTLNNWLYLDSMMGLSMAYRKTDQQDKAIQVLKKAISIEPDYKWAEATLSRLEKS